MPKLRRVSRRETIRALEKLRFMQVRQQHSRSGGPCQRPRAPGASKRNKNVQEARAARAIGPNALEEASETLATFEICVVSIGQ